MAKTFKAIDLDGNGNISKEELLKGYKRLYSNKLSDEEITKEVDLHWE